MTKMYDILNLDATEQAELVKQKKIAPLELVDAVIEQIEQINPIINAVSIPMFDIARQVAQKELPDGPFTGVPFLLKNLFTEYKGTPYTASSAFLTGYVSKCDTELVKRQKRAGLIVLGKTSTPEFGVGAVTEPLLYGPTRNPWNTQCTPGGSSGGAAAAVAARLVPMAHGNDAGGSIRIPASCCGVFGFKPTRARNPVGPSYGDLWNGLSQDHALTRTVRDSAALLDATLGPDIGDPYWSPPLTGHLSEAIKTPPGRLRIAFATSTPMGTELSLDALEAVRQAAVICEQLGHYVEEASPQFDAKLLWESFTKVLTSGIAWIIEDIARKTGLTPREDLFEPMTWGLFELGHKISAPGHMLAITDLQEISRHIARFFINYDIWLTPTTAHEPLRVGVLKPKTKDEAWEVRRRQATFIPYTYIQNVTGQPAMSVPLYWNKEDLPIGAHFAGRFGDEITLFKLAAQLEEAHPWSHKVPPVSIENK